MQGCMNIGNALSLRFCGQSVLGLVDGTMYSTLSLLGRLAVPGTDISRRRQSRRQTASRVPEARRETRVELAEGVGCYWRGNGGGMNEREQGSGRAEREQRMRGAGRVGRWPAD